MYFVLLLVAVTSVEGEGGFECNEENQRHIIVNNDAKYITSPDFPRHYPNSCKCQSSFGTKIEGHVLHVEVGHMQLENWNRSCLDSVTAYDGGIPDKLLTRWCGGDTHSFSTSGQTLLLEFTSDESGSGFGCAFSVWSAPPPKTSCTEAEGPYIEVGKHPVHISPQPLNMSSPNGSSCVYTFQTIRKGDVISLTTSGWQIEAHRYGIEIYDGHNTSFPHMMSWTPIDKLFSDVMSSGNHMTIVPKYDWMEGSDEVLSSFGLAEPFARLESYNGSIRVVAAAKQERCEGAISREATSRPAVFPLPTSLDADGELCPLKLISRDVTHTLRVDVIGDVEEDVLSSLNVTEGSIMDESVTLTRKYNTTTYRSDGPVVYVQGNFSQLPGRIVRLRVLTLDPYSNGKVMKVTAVNSTMSSNLSLENIQSNSYMVYLITADQPDNIIRLNMTSSFSGVIRPNCDQVYVDFFNGSPDDGDLVKRWCPGRDDNVTVDSRMRTLSFIVITTETEPKLSITGSYFSMKEGSLCRVWKDDIPAKRKEIGYVTSPNFPGQYSINNDCVWRIAAPRINYVVVAEVKWSDLPDDCSDMVYVVYGIHPSGETIGRICGQDRKTFRSVGPTLLLHFVSDSQHNHGGFNISYTTEHMSRGQKLEDGPPVGIIAGACIALFVVGGVIYVIVHVYRKRHKQAKKLQESTL